MKTLFGICFLSVMGYGSVHFGRGLSEDQWLKLLRIEPKVETRIEVREKEKLDFRSALDARLARSHISPVIVFCILERESSVSYRMDQIRFEPGFRSKYADSIAKHTKNPHEANQLASSFGPFQVMGLTATEFGYGWHQLTDPEINVDAGMSKIEKCWDNSKSHGRKRVYDLGTCYNGTNEDGQRYARGLVECVSSAAIEQVFENKKG